MHGLGVEINRAKLLIIGVMEGGNTNELFTGLPAIGPWLLAKSQ